jgi:hypothetical protein
MVYCLNEKNEIKELEKLIFNNLFAKAKSFFYTEIPYLIKYPGIVKYLQKRLLFCVWGIKSRSLTV